MHVKHFLASSFPFIVFVFLCLSFVSQWFSPFLLSLSTIVFIIYFFVHFKEVVSDNKNILTVLFILVVLGSTSFISGGDLETISSKLLLLIGLFFTHLTTLHYFKNYKKYTGWFLLVAVFTVVIVNLVSVTNYINNKKELDELLLQSKSIPVLGLHHIHFGVINAFTILILAGLIITRRFKSNKWFVYISLGITVISFHILSSRTGIISLYSSALVGLLVYGFSHKAYKSMILSFVLILFAIMSAYFLSTSFKNKVTNSIEDVQSWGNGDDINFKSMAMRIEAYKVCSNIIAENPAFGVGSGNLDAEMARGYKKIDTPLKYENRVGPHNQFLEFGVKFGLLGVFTLIGYFIILFKESNFNYILISLFLILLVSMMFESLWERQNSILFTSLYISLGYNLFKT